MWTLCRAALVAAALVAGQDTASSSAQKPLGSDDECKHPPYTVSIVSRSPMVLYLHDFLTAEERAHLTLVTYEVSRGARRGGAARCDRAESIILLTATC